MLLKLFPRKYKTAETEYLHIYRLRENGTDLKLAVTRRRATKHDTVHCREGGIVNEHLYPVAISPAREENVICRPAELCERNVINLLVINGKPGGITGLDNGIYASSRTFLPSPDRNKLYVMSKKAFKKLHKDLKNGKL